MSFLPYHIISQSSKDAEMEKDYLAQNGSTEQEEGEDFCWITEKNHSFPQSLVVKLEDETHVGSIEIVTHEVFVPSSMTIAFGVRDTRYHGDKSYHANYHVKSQFSFVENGVFKQKRYLFFNDPALYIRFTVHGFLSGQENPGRQVGLISIVIKGVASGGNFDLPSMLDWNSWKNRQDTGNLLSKRKSPVTPVNTMIQKAPPALYESDTDDEEVIFTKEMLKRLSAKAKELQSNRPASALSDSGVSSTSTVTEKEATVPSTPKAPSTPLSSEPLTPRTRERVLQEIDSFGEQLGISMGKTRRPQRYYFGRRLAELNNATRILEARKEQAIWKEEYALAHDIEEMVKRLKSREAPLKELLTERMDALEKNDLLEAQRLKNRFEFNLTDALDFSGLEKHLTEREMKRLQSDIKRNPGHREEEDE